MTGASIESDVFFFGHGFPGRRHGGREMDRILYGRFLRGRPYRKIHNGYHMYLPRYDVDKRITLLPRRIGFGGVM